jgi:ABC-type cobalamin/Fe3+-siderophores transport system ATPase subunit
MELSLKALSFNRHKKSVLDSISATIPSSGLTCLLGRNGAGKTTLLRILCGDLRPGSGTFFIGEINAGTLSQKDISRYFSIIPQKAPVPSYLTVDEVVALSRFRPKSGLWWRLNDVDKEKIRVAIARCHIGNLKGRRVAELSGGEQQRVWLSFGLASDKIFLILDETLDGMDIFAKSSFFQLLREISREDKGIILATHDLGMVTEYADKAIILRQGKIVYEGSANVNLQQFLVNDEQQ